MVLTLDTAIYRQVINQTLFCSTETTQVHKQSALMY